MKIEHIAILAGAALLVLPGLKSAAPSSGALVASTANNAKLAAATPPTRAAPLYPAISYWSSIVPAAGIYDYAVKHPQLAASVEPQLEMLGNTQSANLPQLQILLNSINPGASISGDIYPGILG